ncbi:MAG: glycosyltransferase family 2 protein [Bacteroidetes bacterium]|nr:glycosyltransferase family 2 protein [Bacteroidota bacterium]
MTYLSVVIPLYKCSAAIPELTQRLKNALPGISEDHEIIFVNDGSPENDWEIVTQLAKGNPKIKGINLSRNFGQHHALTAGLDFADGKWVVVMDGDLQDQPEEIKKLHDKAKEGFDVVFARRHLRIDNFFKRHIAKFFYRLFDYFTDNKTDATAANFGIYTRKVILNYRKMKEQNRAFPLFVRWMGFNTAYVDVQHAGRKSGKSGYSIKTLFALATDIIISHSNKPLVLSIKFGLGMSFLSFIYGIYIIARRYIYDVPLGWSSIMVSIFFIGGLIFANLGMIGLYLGKVFNETKKRPLYIVNETVGELINTEEE